MYKSLPVGKLKKEMIEQGKLVGINIILDNGDTEYIKIEDSWREFIILLLGALYYKYPNKYLKVLMENNILSSNFDVNSSNKVVDDMEVVTIPKTPYKLITDFNSDTIYKVIKKLVKLIDDELELEIISKEMKKVRVTKQKKKEERELSLYDLLNVDTANMEFKEVNILGIRELIEDIGDAVKLLLEILIGGHGTNILDSLEVYNLRGIGIVDREEIECIKLMRIGETNRYLYYNNNDVDAIRYMVELCYQLGIETTLIQFVVTIYN